MDLRDYLVGEERVPARQATSIQLRAEADKTEDPDLKKRLQEAANWREFFEDLHDRILDTFTDKIDSGDREMVQKLLDWETQLSVEYVLEEGLTKLLL